MAAGVKFFQRIGKVFGNHGRWCDRSCLLAPLRFAAHVRDAPDAGFATVFAISKRGVVGFAVFAAATAVAGGFSKASKATKKLTAIFASLGRESV